ncbi:uncharacterized protein LOC143433945 [Arvicanthis niloticus]|uniref:uncharacterized protein LOC143433945 n=1 Tax=Arvicanthis niloticus TaxID=61156 RepID=UPI00402B68DF
MDNESWEDSLDTKDAVPYCSPTTQGITYHLLWMKGHQHLTWNGWPSGLSALTNTTLNLPLLSKIAAYHSVTEDANLLNCEAVLPSLLKDIFQAYSYYIYSETFLH